MKRVECEYGLSCYRRNKQHFIDFTHTYVEDVARKIRDGDIEEIISLGLEPKLIEQSQLVAELIANGEIDSSIAISHQPDEENKTGIKRSLSETDQDLNKQEKHEEYKSPNYKKLKTGEMSTSVGVESVDQKTLEKSVAERVSKSTPFYFFLSMISSLPETSTQPFTLKFADLLDPSLGLLKESVQFNFMVEPGWLLAQYCEHHVQRKPLLIIYGVETPELLSIRNSVPTIEAFRVKPKYPFGSHHSKMAIMCYTNGSLRVIVHTGNLIESDWEDRTQGIWISPSCPPLTSAEENGDSHTGFKRDLLRYMESYSLPVLQKWIDKIRRSDMSAINVCFIPSSPGSFDLKPENDEVPKWGHDHLGWLLKKHASTEEKGSIVMQCSSIGSLGPTPSSWLIGELVKSMSLTNNPKLNTPDVHVIYPCHQDVENSLHGVSGGGCLPYSRQGHFKQLWFRDYLRKWRSEAVCRTRAMPHIKSYIRLNDDMTKASWFVLTSGNLSKAAWGMRTKKANTIMIQSFEAGVLFLPKFICGENSFDVGRDFVLPYDLPLTEYSKEDKPWFIDELR